MTFKQIYNIVRRVCVVLHTHRFVFCGDAVKILIVILGREWHVGQNSWSLVSYMWTIAYDWPTGSFLNYNWLLSSLPPTHRNSTPYNIHICVQLDSSTTSQNIHYHHYVTYSQHVSFLLPRCTCIAIHAHPCLMYSFLLIRTGAVFCKANVHHQMCDVSSLSQMVGRSGGRLVGRSVG